jgi:hypothetical protein
MIGGCDPPHQTLWRQQEHLGVWDPAANAITAPAVVASQPVADRISHRGNLAEPAPTRYQDAD